MVGATADAVMNGDGMAPHPSKKGMGFSAFDWGSRQKEVFHP
ncbi:MAG: hypothetical protein WA783_02695 [Phormidesmis sp.]